MRSIPVWWRADRTVARGWWVVLDVVVAWASAGIAIGGAGSPASLGHGPVPERIAAVVWFASLAGRRIAPVGALWAGAAATVAVVAAGEPVTNLSLASALPLVVLARTRPPAAAAALAAVPVAAVLLALAGRPGFALACTVHAASAGVGLATRLRLQRAEQRRRAAAELRAEKLLADERARMARELHDAVGHAVTVMVTHAGAARLCLPDGPPDVRAALERIERVGRDAMADLDRVLGLLQPAPPLAQALRALLADLPPHLSPALQLPSEVHHLTTEQSETIRRIVQESLTNTLKHSTATATTVRLTTAPHATRLTVTDNGSPVPQLAPRPAPRTPPRGLASMRHRVTALGGTLTAGPDPDADGWRVEVQLPCR
ncbi:sensor histidine kinase [Kitasatospora sp. CB01950]|uniref:sensor histidine kinase n=1 Tax=Kitasatospora sp. CB01950 TaxID=1703930 RepID=UPI000AE08F06|nr:histidine kinase [Kitasatospora sp. CB01950]